MKKFIPFFLLLLTAASLPALDFFPPIGGFFGLGPELNGQTRKGIAFGGGFTLGMDLNEHFSAGIKNSFFHNFDTVGALELNLFFRYYLPWLRVPKKSDGPFVQAELGAVVLFETGYYQYAEAAPAFSGGISIGWRFNLGENWFIDPVIRAGYPHIWGAGVTVGFKYESRGQREIEYREVTIIEYRDREVIIKEDLIISPEPAIVEEPLEEQIEEPVDESIEEPIGEPIEEPIIILAPEITSLTLSIDYSPRFFSPDGDGINDLLYINLGARSEYPVVSWGLEIYDPDTGELFNSTGGEGHPPAQIIWDGLGINERIPISGADYPFVYFAENSIGTSSAVRGNLRISLMNIRQKGERLEITAPPVFFRPDYPDFDGLSEETLAMNADTFELVARIINNLRDYTLIVEGHANPTTPEGAERETEESSLQILSEQRAQRVVEELVIRGVERERIIAVGFGGTMPIIPWDDIDNRWRNRRVEFILMRNEE